MNWQRASYLMRKFLGGLAVICIAMFWIFLFGRQWISALIYLLCFIAIEITLWKTRITMPKDLKEAFFAPFEFPKEQ